MCPHSGTPRWWRSGSLFDSSLLQDDRGYTTVSFLPETIGVVQPLHFSPRRLDLHSLFTSTRDSGGCIAIIVLHEAVVL